MAASSGTWWHDTESRMPLHKDRPPVKRIEVTIEHSDGTTVKITAVKPTMPNYAITWPDSRRFLSSAEVTPPPPGPAEVSVSFGAHPEHEIDVSVEAHSAPESRATDHD
jgi:hypothetical protein